MSLNPRIHYWQGRRVWLVGASSGIGRATAALLHARGAQVIVSARNAQALQAFVDEHPGSVAVPLDTAHTAQVKAAAQQVLAGGPLDLVCYCAGECQLPRAQRRQLLLQPDAIGERRDQQQHQDRIEDDAGHVSACPWSDGWRPRPRSGLPHGWRYAGPCDPCGPS